jgi:hypothetical protein
MAVKLSYLNTLVLLQAFETYWAYYSVTSGKIYATACRKAASDLVVALKTIAEDDQRIFDPEALGLEADIEPQKIFTHLENWNSSGAIAPFESISLSIRYLVPYLSALKSLMLEITGLTIIPASQTNREELLYKEGVARWEAHLPTMLLMGKDSPSDLLASASAVSSIVVTGTIKGQQDLMTYAKDSSSYASFILQFIERTRMLVDEYMGIFDKFTGSGFIAYFNKAICEKTGLDFVDCFINFVRDETVFAKDLFNDWSKNIRRLPSDALGLSMGADIGSIQLQDLAGQLVSIGEALIWSRRLAAIGNAGEVIVNNLLHEACAGHSGLQAEEQIGESDTGEKIVLRALSFS